MWKFFNRGQNQMAQKRRTGIAACTGRSLHDNRRIAGAGGLHNGAHLLQVVDIKGRHAVTVFGSVVEQLAQAD